MCSWFSLNIFVGVVGNVVLVGRGVDVIYLVYNYTAIPILYIQNFSGIEKITTKMAEQQVVYEQQPQQFQFVQPQIGMPASFKSFQDFLRELFLQHSLQ